MKYCHITYWQNDYAMLKFDFPAQLTFLPDVTSFFVGWSRYTKSARRRSVFSPAPVSYVQYVFPRYFCKFQSITNIRTHFTGAINFPCYKSWLHYEVGDWKKNRGKKLAALTPGGEKRESRLQDFTRPFFSRCLFASRSTNLAKEVLHLSLGEN